MATIPLTISGIREAKQQLEELGNEFDKFKKDPIKSKKLATEFNTLSDSIDKAEKSFNELNDSGKLLTATFEDIYGDGIQPMTSRIGELEDRMYELALAGQANTEEFNQMAQEAAKLRSTIIETDRQVDLLAENKGFSVFGTGIRQVGDSLLRLDFEGASRDAKALNGAVGSLGTMGAKALKGLGSTVVQLGKAFAKMGMALLANPVFLLAAVVVGVVAAVTALMNELGLLQPILDAVGQVFGWIKEQLDKVVQALKDFTDWIGITNNAAKDLIAEQIKGAENIVDRTKEIEQSITSRYDKEIRLAQIAGDDTTSIEIEKQKALVKTAEVRQKAIEQQIKALEVLGDADEERLQQLRDALKETETTIKTANDEIDVLNAQRDKEAQDRRNEQVAKDREAYQKRLEEQRKFEEERLRVARQIQDLELALMDDGITKEIEQNAIQYQRLIEDVQNNEALLQEEKERLTALYAEQQFEKEKDIELKYQQELWDALDAAEKERKEKKRLEREQELADQEAFNNALLMASGVYFKKAEEQEMTYAEAKEKLQETMFNSFSGLANSLEQAGIKSAALQKTLALVEIASNTAKALSSVIAGATAASTAAGPAAPFVLAGYIASGIATVASGIASAYAALKEAPSIGGGVSGGGSPALASASNVQSATPSFELFGQNNDLNNLSAPQDNEQTQEIKVKAFVSETEVTDTQNTIKKIKESATL